MALAADLLKRYESLKASRGTWETHWQEVAQVIAPRKSDMLGARTEGDKRNQRVYDSTGAHANELLASGIYGMATNPATRWFGLRVLDDELMERESVKEYLAEVEGAMFRALYSPGASIASHLHELFLDLSSMGTSVMFIGERDGGPVFQTRHLREVYIAEDADGEIDTVFRCFEMTARQIAQKWDTVPDVVNKHIMAQKWDKKFEIVHGVFPREDRIERSALREDLPIASVYILKEGKEILDNGGFDEFPFVVPRWYKNPGEVYGRSPGMTALPDVKMLQEMMKVHIRAAQKLVDPPLQVPDDAAFSPIKTMPGGLNFIRPGSQILPLQTGGRLDLSFEIMEDVRNRIRSTFFVDVIQFFQTSGNETATEVLQRTQERMRLLGPILGRMEAELLGPLIARVFGIMDRAGGLPPPPEELEEESFTVEFVSPIATAQRMGEVDQFVQWLGLVGQTMQIRPEVGDRVNWKAIPSWTAERLRVDPELTLSDEEVEEEGADQQRQLANVAQLAQPAKDGAQAAKAFAEAQQIAGAG